MLYQCAYLQKPVFHIIYIESSFKTFKSWIPLIYLQETVKTVQCFVPYENLQAVKFIPNREWFVVGYSGGTLEIYNIGSDSNYRLFNMMTKSGIGSISHFSPIQLSLTCWWCQIEILLCGTGRSGRPFGYIIVILMFYIIYPMPNLTGRTRLAFV